MIFVPQFICFFASCDDFLVLPSIRFIARRDDFCGAGCQPAADWGRPLGPACWQPFVKSQTEGSRLRLAAMWAGCHPGVNLRRIVNPPAMGFQLFAAVDPEL
jgi:hypothetical protein